MHRFVLVALSLIVVALLVSVARAQGTPQTYVPLVLKAGTPLPTPTATPATYAKDEEPNLPIPDGPQGRVTTTLAVPDAIIIREMRVFLNIAHQDVGDLDVRLSHPEGTVIVLHEQGQDPGGDSIRRWFPITGADLARIRGTAAQGLWTLEVRDLVENRTGELRSWQLEIYP